MPKEIKKLLNLFIMRIACVDNTATERIALESFLDESFRECRKSIGHLLVARLYPISREELLINSLPDCIVIGHGFELDKALHLVREIRSISVDVPLYVFLKSELYNVQNLKRFGHYVNDIFSENDIASRFVFKLTTVESLANDKKKGYLFSFQGIKGGVGTTSLVGGFAHALHDLGESIAVVDFSRRGEFCQFCLSEKWQSSSYAQLLIDGQLPDNEHLEKSLIFLSNGIPVLPPPSGSDELRELWLRDPSRLEIGLSFIELLLERYSVVLVDLAHAEGILPFAVECRSDARIFVSSNDPGAIHLLTHRVDDLTMPIEGTTTFLINQIYENGLNHEDILDFIAWSPNFTEELLYPTSIPFEKKGSLWMGTGNTMFTESSAGLQRALKKFIADAIGLEVKSTRKTKKIPFEIVFKSLSGKNKQTLIPFSKRKMIPYFEGPQEILEKNKVNRETITLENEVIKVNKKLEDIAIKTELDVNVSPDTENISTENKDTQKTSEDEFVYEPPKIRANK